MNRRDSCMNLNAFEFNLGILVTGTQRHTNRFVWNAIVQNEIRCQFHSRILSRVIHVSQYYCVAKYDSPCVRERWAHNLTWFVVLGASELQYHRINQMAKHIVIWQEFQYFSVLFIRLYFICTSHRRQGVSFLFHYSHSSSTSTKYMLAPWASGKMEMKKLSTICTKSNPCVCFYLNAPSQFMLKKKKIQWHRRVYCWARMQKRTPLFVLRRRLDQVNMFVRSFFADENDSCFSSKCKCLSIQLCQPCEPRTICKFITKQMNGRMNWKESFFTFGIFAAVCSFGIHFDFLSSEIQCYRWIFVWSLHNYMYLSTSRSTAIQIHAT